MPLIELVQLMRLTQLMQLTTVAGFLFASTWAFAFSPPKSLETLSSTATTSYTAIQWTDNSAPTQANLAPKLKDFVRNSSAFEISPFTNLDIKGARLAFFPEIASLLQSAANPTPVLNDATSAACNQLSIDSICALSSEETESLKESSRACLRFTKPESFVEDLIKDGFAPGVPKAANLETIEDLLAISGLPLSRIPLPGNFADNRSSPELRLIIQKIRAEKLHTQLRSDSIALERISNRLAGYPKCSTSEAAKIDSRIDALKEFDQQLTLIESTGKTRAQADLNQLVKRGRTRGILPFPTLTDHERATLSMTLIATFWRMRGGALIRMPGTQIARSLFASLPLSKITQLNGGDLIQSSEADSLGEAHRFALIWRGWGKFQSMGNSPGQGDRFENLVSMTDRGAYQVESGRSMLRDHGFDTTMYEIGGLQMGPCYYYARWAPIAITLGMNHEVDSSLKVKGDGTNPYEYYIDNSTSWGEFCSGAAIGLGLSKTLLNGIATAK